MQGLAIGRIVHLVGGKKTQGFQAGVHLAAIVVAVTDKERGVCNLAAFWPSGPGGPFAGEVPYSETPADGTWHWPERE